MNLEGVLRVLDGGRIYYGLRLTHRVMEDTNGQLIAMDVPIARTGVQDYYGHELSPELEANRPYHIERLPDDVFDAKFMASLENVPLTDSHPSIDVNIYNNKDLQKGFIRNIRRGKLDVRGLDPKYADSEGNNVLLADVVINDAEMITRVKSQLGLPEDSRTIDVSVGYDAEYAESKIEDGFRQIPINGNHLALVAKGRAGVTKIRDGKGDKEMKRIIIKTKDSEYELFGFTEDEAIEYIASLESQVEDGGIKEYVFSIKGMNGEPYVSGNLNGKSLEDRMEKLRLIASQFSNVSKACLYYGGKQVGEV